MVIVFYDETENQVYVATDSSPIRTCDINDGHLLDFIPNDDILFIQAGSLVTKKQFANWINGNFNLSVEAITTEPEEKQKQYLHPASNGIIVIDDINTVKYPRGVRMKGKYDFIPINEIGEDVLTNSAIFRSLLKAKKIEIVDEEYVKKNLHKTMRKISPADAALDKILVPSGVRAEAVAENGGLDTSEDQGNISVRIEI